MQRFLTEIKKLTSLHLGLLAVLLLSWILLSNHLWHNDVLFHTDLARDFLVLDEMISTKNITLIGPRSGGIPGVFHGPLWYYMSVVPFFLSSGNPVAMGWFWWLLGVSSTLLFLVTTLRLTKNTTVSILATIGFSLALLPFAAHPVNNYLADLLSFVVFAFWLQWLITKKWMFSLLGWLALGFLVQFQMAFAVPIAVIWLPVFLFIIWRSREYRQLLSLLLFGIPLLTFLLFEVRHEWLQVRSVIAYMQEPSRSGISLLERVGVRAISSVTEGVNIFRLPLFLAFIPVALFGVLGWKTGKPLVRKSLALFAYWYFAWWILACAFSGTVWGYYFSPFIGILFLCAALVAASSRWAKYALCFLVIWLAMNSGNSLFYQAGRFNSSSWALLSEIANEALSQPDTGYFVYSQDQFAYSLKYAFAFTEKNHPEMNISAFEKKPRTVLVKAADDPQNPFMTAEHWQRSSLAIEEEPVEVKAFPFGYRLERYALDEDTIAKPIDPNLILDLHFR